MTKKVLGVGPSMAADSQTVSHLKVALGVSLSRDPNIQIHSLTTGHLAKPLASSGGVQQPAPSQQPSQQGGDSSAKK
jgi:hypothetical protein